MESLETLALIAAIAKPSLRDSLNVEDFTGKTQLAAKAIKDGKSKDAKDQTKKWLETLGVTWDGKSGIAEAIVAALQERKRIQRAETQLKLMQWRLRFPHIAGPEAVEEALKVAKAIEEMRNADSQ